MKHIFPLALLAAFVTAMVGCALPAQMQQQGAKKDPPAVRTEKYGYVDRQDASMSVYGASTYEILGPVAWEDKHKCSVLDFVTFATIESDKLGGAQDVINVRAEELCKTTNGEKKCSCKYWGLAIRYKMLSVNEAKEIAPVTEKAETPASEEQ